MAQSNLSRALVISIDSVDGFGEIAYDLRSPRRSGEPASEPERTANAADFRALANLMLGSAALGDLLSASTGLFGGSVLGNGQL